MSRAAHPIIELLRRDPRFSVEAYQFVREALAYAQETLGYGAGPDEPGPAEDAPDEGDASRPRVAERHLTGQELCEAIRLYALEQYGLMARLVLKSWGLTTTGDFGDVVYNLIDVGWMKKSPEDRREHFDDVYDFETAFGRDFRITVPGE